MANYTTVEALARSSFEHPRLVLASWIVLISVSLLGVLRLSIETNTESVLDHRSEAWRFYQESQGQFGTDEAITVAISGTQPFDRDSLALVFKLTGELESLEGIRRVDSISSVPIVESKPNGDISLDSPMEFGPPATQAEASAIGVRVLADRIAPDLLASRDGKVLALNLLLDAQGVAASNVVLDRLAEKLPRSGLWVSGVPVFRVETDARTRSELATFIPLTALFIAALLFAIFRSLFATVFPLAVSSSGTCVVLGAMGALEVPLTISTVILPSVFLAMGCAYSMHLLMETAGASGPEEVSTAIASVAGPLALSGLTTAIGFAAVAVVPIDALRQLGGFGALGTFTLVAAALTAGPAILALWPGIRVSSWFVEWVRSPFQTRLVEFVLRKPKVVVLSWAVIALGCGIGATRIRVETDVTRWFPKGGLVRESYESIRSSLSGISPMNIIVTSDVPDAITHPEVVHAIDRMAEALRRDPAIGKVISIADPLRELHGGFVGNIAEPLPVDQRSIAQYFLILESKEHFRDLVSSDRSMANVILRVNNNGSEHLLSISDSVDRWWAEHGVEGVTVRTTGIMYEFARAQHAIAVGQLQGLALDLATVAVLLFAILRVPKIAFVAVVANALPLVVIFGVLGFAGIPLDAGTVVVGNLALGIAVDETVFVLSAYVTQRSLSRSGAASIAVSVRHVLPALLATTTAVVTGFAILTLSNFAFTAKLGALTASVMVICIAANVTLLPALLALLDLPKRTS